jgi:hypothetical protein
VYFYANHIVHEIAPMQHLELAYPAISRHKLARKTIKPPPGMSIPPSGATHWPRNPLRNNELTPVMHICKDLHMISYEVQSWGLAR